MTKERQNGSWFPKSSSVLLHFLLLLLLLKNSFSFVNISEIKMWPRAWSWGKTPVACAPWPCAWALHLPTESTLTCYTTGSLVKTSGSGLFWCSRAFQQSLCFCPQETDFHDKTDKTERWVLASQDLELVTTQGLNILNLQEFFPHKEFFWYILSLNFPAYLSPCYPSTVSVASQVHILSVSDV